MVFETYIGYFEKKCLDEFVMKRFVKYELVVFIVSFNLFKTLLEYINNDIKFNGVSKCSWF